MSTSENRVGAIARSTYSLIGLISPIATVGSTCATAAALRNDDASDRPWFARPIVRRAEAKEAIGNEQPSRPGSASVRCR